MSFKDDWLPLTELTLQGNLTIAGFAQKTWTAKRGVCEIHLHANSGVARIDWQHTSVIVSPAVIQHGTLNIAEEYDNARRVELANAGLSAVVAPSAQDPNPADAEPRPDLVSLPSRADEILAEFDEPKTTTFRRKPGRKPKAD